MGLLSKQQILAAEDMVTRQVNVPEWGGDVIVRMLTGLERDQFDASIVGDADMKGKQERLHNIRARLLSLCLVDQEGNRLFAEADVIALGAKCAKAIDRIYGIAAALSGISDDDVKELEKNCGGGVDAD